MDEAKIREAIDLLERGIAAGDAGEPDDWSQVQQALDILRRLVGSEN